MEKRNLERKMKQRQKEKERMNDRQIGRIQCLTRETVRFNECYF